VIHTLIELMLIRRAASSVATIVRCRSRRPREAQHAVSQVLSLEQGHDHKNEDLPGHRQRLQQWSDNILDPTTWYDRRKRANLGPLG
jgi:hypothetical protein